MGRILIVDDEVAILNSLSPILEDEGYQVTVAKSGAEALKTLVSEPPDLMLLDLKMPRMNGFDVLEWLRTQPGLKRLLVTVLTSSDQLQDINWAYDLGANSYLLKPHSTNDLTEVVKRLQRYWLELNRNPVLLNQY